MSFLSCSPETSRHFADRKLSLTAAAKTSFDISVVRALFAHGNEALPDSWDRARRLIVVGDAAVADRMMLLRSFLDGLRREGQLDEYLVVDGTGSADAGLGGCDALIDAALLGSLGRRDAFVAYCGGRTSRLVAVAAASFRRGTRAVRIHRDIAAVVTAVKDGNRPRLDDEPISTLQRTTQVVVDADGVLVARPIAPAEQAATLLLALFDRQVLAQIGQTDGRCGWRAEALSGVLRLSQRFCPGHPAWRVGDAFLPLAPRGLDQARANAWSLLCAAGVARKLALLDGGIVTELEAGAARWCLDAFRPLAAGVEPDAARRWLAKAQVAADGNVTLCLPADNGAVEVTIDRAVLASALTSGPATGRSIMVRPPARPRSAVCRGTHSRTAVTVDGTTLLSFPVRFAEGVLDYRQDALVGLLPPGCQILAVADTYRPDQINLVHDLLDAYQARGLISSYSLLPVAARRSGKTLGEVRQVIAEADKLGLTDKDRLIVIGGGTIMDIVGYAAYLYSGQTPYIRIPTTLVGMIDAGIGLKVGVDVGSRKNLLGAYHPPLACVCDVGFLQTLPVAERRCGLAEAIKIGTVCDADLFGSIEKHHADVLSGRDTPQVRAILTGSIACMLRELESNPFEASTRRLPDFGHEFGHALESLSHYRLRHGEAVAIGMALSCSLAASIGILPEPELRRILRLLANVGLPLYDRACDPAVLWRKLNDEVLPHKAGHLYLVVAGTIGGGAFIDSIDQLSEQMLTRACRALLVSDPGGRS
jgi:2-epi-5-epi-valiolone synthase